MVSVGSILEGKVVSVMPFGAFVDIGNKQSGLVHISELSSRYVKDINDCVKKGDTVKVKVIKIDESGKISLTMKQAEEKKERATKIANTLSNNNIWKSHGRAINMQELESMNLKINDYGNKRKINCSRRNRW